MNPETSKWTTVSTRLVKSEVEREPEWMEWSTLDSFWHGFFSSYFFLYKQEAGAADPESVLPIDRLTGSLSRALEHFYPFAGRLMKPEKDKTQLLFCNNAGVPFSHKRYDGVLSDLIDVEQFQPNEYISGLYDVHPGAQVFDASGLPTLIIQVTDFKCGTRCLSTSWSHTVADGFSGTHFLSSWAQVARGEPISLIPVHNRSLLTPRKSSPVLDGGSVKFFNTVFKEPAAVEFTEPEEGVGIKTMKLSKKRMDELKAEGNRDAQDSILTTVECISAHLWRLVTEKRKHEPHELSRFMILVNGRPRMKDVPAGYFGNCILLTVSTMMVGELLSKPLGHAATVIHSANKCVNEDLIRDFIDWLSVNKFQWSSIGDEPFMPRDPRANLHSVHASWQTRFPFFELDFGGGRPSHAIRNGFRMGLFSAGMFSALPTSSIAGDITVSIFGENNLLENLPDEL
ncbi:hypothetical protein R1flu_009185 [Riccia fluitans]|uniref:Uncharacterized protein n=1 Tax=Riccia fluitans TaxID=41844 RepID=A0ABD1Z270_9MARC